MSNRPEPANDESDDPKPDPVNRVRELACKLADGDISYDEVALLEQVIADAPEARQAYIEAMHLEAGLLAHSCDGATSID
jgi:hypothetical protein